MHKLAGFLIFISFLTTLYSYFFNNSFLVSSSLLLWASMIFLFMKIKNKKVVLTLIFLSSILFLICYIKDFSVDLKKVFSINQYLITLLIGVGFLRLMLNPKKEDISKDTHNSKGKSGFLKTYLSLHLFGSMINISALLLIADNLYKKTKQLSNLQVLLLTRAFSSDAYWSPFFVSFGVAITFASNLNIVYTSLSGLALALFTFIITYFDINNTQAKKELEEFKGYPLNFSNLVLPFTLAFFVVLIHHFYSDIKIIVLIALLAFILSIVVLPIKDGFTKTFHKYQTHIFTELPNMRSEISLFLAAGMFGVSVSSILSAIGFSLPFNYFDYKIASLVLLLFIVLSFIGIHPIIAISILGHMMAEFNQTLVAITFLMAWGLTVSTSPFSGVNLTLHSRYSVDLKEVMRLNFSFMVKMYLFCVVLLFIVSKSLGI